MSVNYHRSAANLLLATTFLVGCGKPTGQTSPVAPPAVNDNGNGVNLPMPKSGPVPQDAPAANLNIPSDASAEATADQLSMELRRFVAYTRTIPKDFNDFVARHPMKFPAAPTGKHYVIESGKVVVR